MTVCEYQFETFNAHGDDAYLDGFAERLDELYAAGWKLVESKRDPNCKGWWWVELFKARASELATTSDR